MKKVILTSIALAASLNAALSDGEILSIYGGVPQGIDIKIAERIPLNEPKGVEAVVLKISQGDMSQEEIVFIQGDLIFTDIIDPKKRVVYKDHIKQSRTAGQLAKVFKSESKDNVIKLGNDPKKPTILMLTDAECESKNKIYIYAKDEHGFARRFLLVRKNGRWLVDKCQGMDGKNRGL